MSSNKLIEKICDSASDYGSIREIVRSRPSLVLQSGNIGQSALHFAVKRNDSQLVNLLVAWGASTNIRDNYGETPLHLAIRHGKFDVAMSLLQNCAMANIKNNKGHTSLHLLAFCVDERAKEMASVLIEYGASPLEKDYTGCSPLDYAIRSGNLELCSILTVSP